jgi:hypothetical protein
MLFEEFAGIDLAVPLIKLALEEILAREKFPGTTFTLSNNGKRVLLKFGGNTFRLPAAIADPIAWTNRLVVSHLEVYRPELVHTFQPLEYRT